MTRWLADGEVRRPIKAQWAQPWAQPALLLSQLQHRWALSTPFTVMWRGQVLQSAEKPTELTLLLVDQKEAGQHLWSRRAAR